MHRRFVRATAHEGRCVNLRVHFDTWSTLMIDAASSQPMRPGAAPLGRDPGAPLVPGAGETMDDDGHQQLHLCAMAAYASTLDHVRVLLGGSAASLSIRRLPAGMRGAPLQALGLRLLALPDHERQPAIDAFLRAAEEVPAERRGAGLQQLIDAARTGTRGLEQRERDAMRHAEAAVRRGDNVCNACQCHGVTLRDLRLALEMLAVRCHAGPAVAAGAGVAKVAALHGISLPGPLAMLASMRSPVHPRRKTGIVHRPASMSQ
ncbi:hypothetical protein M8A51_18110 [Schlegelella sp. S2-27]|uniref:Uncharacterized protein n=1 Tax=Caldimonas mangrovi TaxID=2944811 RepID=A0ABT0YRS2_9BURK|nr:hypothetical protein [Caldimonas mangrovi]MCM5681446.1 hypothetical protein [Caldimonas mangrovi]